MPEFTIEFEVYCEKCGAGLCPNTSTEEADRNRRYPRAYVEPCEKCLSDAKSDGYDEGYQEGEKSAKQDDE